jgi:hypothetical protein
MSAGAGGRVVRRLLALGSLFDLALAVRARGDRFEFTRASSALLRLSRLTRPK